MKFLLLPLVAFALLAPAARADLTIVQNVEGAGQINKMTIRIKGDKARVDASPQVSTIINSRTGDMLNLMHDQKQFLRISADQAKQAAQLAVQAEANKQPAEKPQLKPTGRKQTINGYEAEEYIAKAPAFTATYWISTTYPQGAEIVKHLQAMSPDAWGVSGQGMPDYRDFPGLPLRSTISFGGNEITSTLTSVSQEPLGESLFMAPPEWTEMKMPDLGSMLGGKPGTVKPQGAKPAPSPKR
ncbi:hypothetical protein BH20VER2_BH20VER2_09570 [soil metagenome]|nr:DUF4412 domain-containing protein [Chthoniobacterales bacterium]